MSEQLVTNYINSKYLGKDSPIRESDHFPMPEYNPMDNIRKLIGNPDARKYTLRDLVWLVNPGYCAELDNKFNIPILKLLSMHSTDYRNFLPQPNKKDKHIPNLLIQIARLPEDASSDFMNRFTADISVQLALYGVSQIMYKTKNLTVVKWLIDNIDKTTNKETAFTIKSKTSEHVMHLTFIIAGGYVDILEYLDELGYTMPYQYILSHTKKINVLDWVKSKDLKFMEKLVDTQDVLAIFVNGWINNVIDKLNWFTKELKNIEKSIPWEMPFISTGRPFHNFLSNRFDGRTDDVIRWFFDNGGTCTRGQRNTASDPVQKIIDEYPKSLIPGPDNSIFSTGSDINNGGVEFNIHSNNQIITSMNHYGNVQWSIE